MMIHLILPCMFIINQMFMFSNHPLSMTLFIILQTLLLCLTIGEFFINMWFSYILFLIFLGGMLVIFIYMTSLSPNIMFSSQKMNIMMTTILMTIMSYFVFLFNYSNTSLASISDHQLLMDMKFNYYWESSMNLNNLMTNFNFKLTWFLMLYLLITLLIVTKLSNIFKGPLRQMN
uniref:NADH-ubiquinone oxidoreductase chain 6 n=1 Tax=Ornebius bimaculatus TaxID=2153490 RepID=A0A385I201_9ORTH|nr:NADH dehydrogenase subunit 6 [Ornebius bimaculatus]AXY63934.1 NADH dehydrogenase subunit 6 [Ornebius bimaculatus]